MTAPLLRVEGLDVVDGDGRPRLLGAGLTVAGAGDGGAVVAVLGGAGAGKSALLGAIAGIRPATAGRIWLRGEAIEHPPPERVLARGVALAAQRRRVFRSLSLEENLLLGAMHRSGAEARPGLGRVFELMPELAARRSGPTAVLLAERALDAALPVADYGVLMGRGA